MCVAMITCRAVTLPWGVTTGSGAHSMTRLFSKIWQPSPGIVQARPVTYYARIEKHKLMEYSFGGRHFSP